MDLTTLLPYVITACSTLLVAFLGHTAASVSLNSAISKLRQDLHTGLSLQGIQTDLADVKDVVSALKQVLADAKAPAPPVAGA